MEIPADAIALHDEIYGADLEYGRPLTEAGIEGPVLVFRGVPSWAEPWIRPGDLATTSPESAWRYASMRGAMLAAWVDAGELTYHQRTGDEVELRYVGEEPVGEFVDDPERAVAAYGRPRRGRARPRVGAPSARFEAWASRARARRIVRHVYAKELVPPDARAVCLWRKPRGRDLDRWWIVSPAFPQDPGAWRVSSWDDRGPIGHETSDFQGRPYMDLHQAVDDVLFEHRDARIVEVVDAEGARVRVGPGEACP